jgi:hypothetical protein
MTSSIDSLLQETPQRRPLTKSERFTDALIAGTLMGGIVSPTGLYFGLAFGATISGATYLYGPKTASYQQNKQSS